MKVFNRNVKRIDRLYFWVAWIIVSIVEYVWSSAMAFALWQEYGNIWALVGVSVFFEVYKFLLSCKRFHDAGYSTGYCILCLLLSVVLIGIGMWFTVVIKDSDEDNAWGKNLEREKFEKNREYYAD